MNGKKLINNNWYAIPPYKKGENWTILNEQGELIATFERREDCVMTAEVMSRVFNRLEDENKGSK